MPGLSRTTAHRAARNAASIALADALPGNARIALYTAQGGTLLAVRTLARPCGDVRASDGRLVLAAGSSADMVLASGAVTWGEWQQGDGAPISGGHVTDPDGNITEAGALVPHPQGIGPFVLGGGNGTMVYAGGQINLAVGLLG